jgi:hypothetical protein
MTGFATECLSNINFRINFEKKMLLGLKFFLNKLKKLFYHKNVINVLKI